MVKLPKYLRALTRSLNYSGGYGDFVTGVGQTQPCKEKGGSGFWQGEWVDLGKWKNSPPVRGKWVINVYGKISGATWVMWAGREPRHRQKHLRGEATSFMPPQAVQNPLAPYITNTLRKGRTT